MGAMLLTVAGENSDVCSYTCTYSCTSYATCTCVYEPRYIHVDGRVCKYSKRWLESYTVYRLCRWKNEDGEIM